MMNFADCLEYIPKVKKLNNFNKFIYFHIICSHIVFILKIGTLYMHIGQLLKVLQIQINYLESIFIV